MMFGEMTRANGEILRAGRAVSRVTGMLAAVACFGVLAPQAAEAGSAGAQLRVTATVLPRCQELNVAGHRQINAVYTCALQSAKLVWQMNEVSVLSAPGAAPRVSRQADQVVVLF
ncbi:MAG TPA: hypothetical protein VF859_01970 [Burkholderiales bacterium]